MTHTTPVRRSLILLSAATALSLSACSLNIGGSSTPEADSATAGPGAASTQAAPAAPGAGSSGSASAGSTSSSGQAVPGYAVGEIPPVPLFTLPDVSLLTDSGSAFTPDLTRSIASVPGVTVSPARCEQPGVLATSTTVLGGDGSMSHSSDSGSVTNHGDGSGTYTDGQVSIVNHGDGSGSYTNGRISMTLHGDGSGTYTDGTLSVTVHGDGSGTYTNGLTGESITIHSDGSGTYTDGRVSIVNHGDGSGTYSDAALSIVNYGDGTALVDGRDVEADPLPKVGQVGDLPSIEAIAPVRSCGTVITLEDGVLFDFGSAEVRPDASTTLGNLATVLTDSGAPSIQVYGHTDSVSDDAFNQTLSEQRAQAVVAALQGNGVTASMEAAGYGETRPVAPNENPDGSDNPAGRQLNRRVEIFIPAF